VLSDGSTDPAVEELRSNNKLDWSRAVIHSFHVRASRKQRYRRLVRDHGWYAVMSSFADG
jgi:hypothetical protein